MTAPIQEGGITGAYALHRALDPISLSSLVRIMKEPCLMSPRQRFESDFLADTGIINLLRLEYLRSGDFAAIFAAYQDSRREPSSHRYESLIALLLISIVGAVVSGVVLEEYKRNREGIKQWLGRLLAGSHGSLRVQEAEKTLHLLGDGSGQSGAKFVTTEPHQVRDDFLALARCYTARSMYEDGIIKKSEYDDLVAFFLHGAPSPHKDLLGRHHHYAESPGDHPPIEHQSSRILLSASAYAKGTVARSIEEFGLEVPSVPTNPDVLLRGIPASPGIAKGKCEHLCEPAERAHSTSAPILLADSRQYTPELVPQLGDRRAVVTTNCGITGHIPVICRGLGIPCVILGAGHFAQIRAGDSILVSGTQGIVATGDLIG